MGQFDGLELQSHLGKGGFGSVYKAWYSKKQVMVAVKTERVNADQTGVLQ
jgi:hypothetical protein